MYIYLAFPEDDLLFLYPAMKISGAFYSISRAWYFGAVERKGEIFITEPYVDYLTGAWLVSITQAIYHRNGELQAVIGVDYFLDLLFEGINDIQILDSGFVAMISNGGAVVSSPDVWDNGEAVYRIYGEETGLDMDDWV